MAWNRNCPALVDEFIHAQVISRGLDERTAIAYRMDLENFYLWPEGGLSGISFQGEGAPLVHHFQKTEGVWILSGLSGVQGHPEGPPSAETGGPFQGGFH